MSVNFSPSEILNPTTNKPLVRLVTPALVLLTPEEQIQRFLQEVEAAGRTGYRSEDKITEDSATRFCRMLLARGHESVLEHCSVSVRITCDRATSHQIVRHRLCAFSQESQRYCAYNNDPLDVILPPLQNQQSRGVLIYAASLAAQTYNALRAAGEDPEVARAVLPNCTATQLVMTANIREWRHIFRERAVNLHAQTQIRFLMFSLLQRLIVLAPGLFADFTEAISATLPIGWLADVPQEWLGQS